MGYGQEELQEESSQDEYEQAASTIPELSTMSVSVSKPIYVTNNSVKTTVLDTKITSTAPA